jgi:hypothetical protein
MVPPVPPVAVVVGADGAAPDPPPTPLTRGAAVGVVRGPFGPVLALRGAGLGADIMRKGSQTRGDIVGVAVLSSGNIKRCGLPCTEDKNELMIARSAQE